MLVRPELTKARLARVPKLTKSPASHHAARTPHQPPLTARARPSPTQGLLCGSGTGHGDSPIRLASRVSRSAAYLGVQAEAGAGRCVARTPGEINSAPQCASAIERQAPLSGHQDSGSPCPCHRVNSTLVLSVIGRPGPRSYPTGPVRHRQRQQPGQVNPTAAACTRDWTQARISSSIAHLTEFPIYEFNVAILSR